MKEETASALVAAFERDLVSHGRKPFTTARAKRILDAYFGSMYARDAYGNWMVGDAKRWHHAKQSTQYQEKLYGRWRNVKTSSPMELAEKLLLAASEQFDVPSHLVERVTTTRAKKAASRAERKRKALSFEQSMILRWKAARIVLYERWAEGYVAVVKRVPSAIKEMQDSIAVQADVLEESAISEIEPCADFARPPLVMFIDPPNVKGHDFTIKWKEVLKGVTVHARVLPVGDATWWRRTEGLHPKLGRVWVEADGFTIQGSFALLGDKQVVASVLEYDDQLDSGDAHAKRVGRVLQGAWAMMLRALHVDVFTILFRHPGLQYEQRSAYDMETELWELDW